MKTYYAFIVALAMACVVSVSQPVLAEDGYVRVPTSLEEIQDQDFRQALAAYSSNYDTLARGSQIFDFTHVYRDRHGFMPTLQPQDQEYVITTMPAPVTLEPVFEREVQTVTLPEPPVAAPAYTQATTVYYNTEPVYEYRHGRWFRRR